MGRRMSVTPIWAMTDPSRSSTSECTTDCGCTTTSMRSGPVSNSQRASMTSRPLFISVAESTVILRPMRQVGWARASAGRTSSRRSAGHSRNGPPEAVSTSRRTSADGRPWRHWWMALCSLSTGSTATPRRRAAAMTSPPAMTRTSLLARAIVFRASMAASTASSAVVPVVAHSTRSTAGWVATASSPSAPLAECSTPARTDAGTAARTAARPSSAATENTRGRWRSTCSASRDVLAPAARPTTSIRSGCAAATASALTPMDPVDPRIAMRLTRAAPPRRPWTPNRRLGRPRTSCPNRS